MIPLVGIKDDKYGVERQRCRSFFHRESPKRFSGKTPCGFLKNMYLCNVNFKKEVI
jgi:hypothetical protein